MASSISIPPKTRFSENVWAGATATVFVATKWGRSSPLRCFARVQNQRTREAQPQCSRQFPPTQEVNGTVNRNVNRVFHAPFTFPHQKRRLNLIRIFAPYHYRGLRNKKCKRQIATGIGAYLSLLLLPGLSCCGPLGWGYLERVKW
jgi:hypothetical protein